MGSGVKGFTLLGYTIYGIKLDVTLFGKERFIKGERLLSNYQRQVHAHPSNEETPVGQFNIP